MKKFIVIAIVALLGFQSSKAQKVTAPDNKGQWVVFLDNKYHPTMGDVLEIAKGMPYMKQDTLYHTKTGKKFFVYYPKEWVNLMKEILTKVKGSQVTDIHKELSEGEIVSADDNVSTTTKNYGVTKNGKPFVVDDNYKGTDSTEFLVYKGYRVLKPYKACMNPQNPNITKKSESVPEPPKVDTVKKVEPPAVAKTGPSDIEEYIPEKTPAAADVAKTETRKIVIGDKIDENKGTFTRKVDNYTTQNYDDRPRNTLRIFFNINPVRQGGRYFYPMPQTPDTRHDPPPLGGGNNGRWDPPFLSF